MPTDEHKPHSELHILSCPRSLVEQLEAAQKVLRMIGECGDALVEDGYGYLVVEASDALGSNPASDSPSLREQLEAYEKALREIAENDLTALQTRAGAHAYRQTRQFARTVLDSFPASEPKP